MDAEQPQYIDRRSSRDWADAMERLFSLAGISCEAGWDLEDSTHKIDAVRERMEELYGRVDQS